MKLIVLMIVALTCIGHWAHGEDKEAAIPETMFPDVGSRLVKSEQIELDPESDDKLQFTYGTIYDSGVELDRVSKDGDIIWRNQVASLGVAHSKYSQKVWVRIEKEGKIQVTSV